MNHRRLHAFLVIICAVLLCPAFLRAEPPLEAVTFALSPGVVYVPLAEAARELRWKIVKDDSGRCVRLGAVPVAPAR